MKSNIIFLNRYGHFPETRKRIFLPCFIQNNSWHLAKSTIGYPRSLFSNDFLPNIYFRAFQMSLSTDSPRRDSVHKSCSYISCSISKMRDCFQTVRGITSGFRDYLPRWRYKPRWKIKSCLKALIQRMCSIYNHNGRCWNSLRFPRILLSGKLRIRNIIEFGRSEFEISSIPGLGTLCPKLQAKGGC